MTLPLEDRVGLDDDTRSAIEQALRTHTMLDKVMRWAFSGQPERDVTNVVVQDEYTHDVVVRWSDALYLVYDAT